MSAPALIGIRTSAAVSDRDLAPTLDRWQIDGGVTAVFLATQSASGYAATPHARYYSNTLLGPPMSNADALEPLLASAATRDLAVYSALSESTAADQARRLPGWVEVLEIDVFGRRGQLPCFRNPDYRNWWLSVAEDQVKSYPVSGLSYTLDRPTPLTSVLSQNAPTCFCTHCCAQADRQRIDADRAREGFRQLLDPAGPTAVAVSGGENPAVVLFRILLRFPEVAAWESLWMQGYLGLQQQQYGAVKAIAPQVAVGCHLPSAYADSPLYRAQDPLAERARYADFLSHGTVRRRRVERPVLGVSARTADSFAADVLGVPLSVIEADKNDGDGGQPSTYVQIADSDDVAVALQAGADGVIYTEALGTDAQGAALKSAAQAVLRRGDTP
ncbi:MAG: hypothetical protein ABWX96_17125 [Propionibacteriaceae bacterium]